MLGVSIVLYRSPPTGVVATIRGLAAQTARPDLVAVHANGVDDVDSAGLIRNLAAELGDLPHLLSSSSENRGFSGGHNALLRTLFDAGCDAVVVLNPDLVLDPMALAILSEAPPVIPGPALMGPILELGDATTIAPSGRIDSLGITWVSGGRHLDYRQGEPMTGLPTGPVQVAGISGACLLVTRAVYERIVAASGEFFDEDFIAYREDAELAYRAQLLGVRSYLVPAARGVHARRLRGTARGADPAIDRLGVRNRFLMAFKYGTQRPGGLAGGIARDVVVLAAVALRERSSWSGVTDAWRLRRHMRRKGLQVRAFRGSRQ